MTPVVSRAEARELDRLASEQHGVPSLTLMENAGLAAAEAILRDSPNARRAAVVCGTGNNGGDGFVVARRLLSKGIEVDVVLTCDPARLRGNARVTFDALAGSGAGLVRADELGPAELDRRLEAAELVIDALFGTGLDREVQGASRTLVERINLAPGRCVALDLPSGLDADTGVPLGVAVRAAHTVTFAALKRGLATPLGLAHAGRVEVVDIGIPPEAAERMSIGAGALEVSDIRPVIRERSVLAHKAAAGRVLGLAGSPGKIGAGLLVGQGALRAGAGLVTLAAEPATAQAFELRVLEAMTARLELSAPDAALSALFERTDVIAVGSGLGTDERARRLVDFVVYEWPGTLIVDADAITLFRGRARELGRAKGKLVLTPHPGEMARLLDSSSAAVEADRFGSVREAVERTGATVLLKGARTLIGAPNRPIAVNPTGNALLATGGTGDVLCGVVAALAVGSDPFQAACAGAFVHGLSAELLAKERGVDRGVLAHEIADGIPYALAAVRS